MSDIEVKDLPETNLTGPVITVDGPSGAGKGTLCQMLAAKLNWALLDSGALYRVTALAAKQHAVALDNEAGLEAIAAYLDVQFQVSTEQSGVQVILEGTDVTSNLRTEETGAIASQVAAVNAVRTALLDRQRAFQQMPGLIADGRDMGTVVFPDAELKIYLTASAEERGERRYKQLLESGNNASLAAIIEDIRARDDRDMNRTVAPLKPADDAIVIDSTSMSIEAVFDQVQQAAKKVGLLA
ncbi:MAG TPA: (d)CMP kinase [Oceanospirillales bacterium]|nr:(d)CMP kinase [Oceanospirillales bacterium]|tara:strand:+ start:2214 stop:2936 length:723 start_codon:yes stop_codon:yes gene_type:complete